MRGGALGQAGFLGGTDVAVRRVLTLYVLPRGGAAVRAAGPSAAGAEKTAATARAAR
ncbi:hypothetical protein J2853_007509 [Streptosporangium lutulentum]|uniref:Uncharacterized protein n=1 Tax=Streptosporangium lutulentum TaxID=1461250 RepID=A0ABT9QPV7_9ACTN|nr:hypothetical protein [Streptosporangium lutulentum]